MDPYRSTIRRYIKAAFFSVSGYFRPMAQPVLRCYVSRIHFAAPIPLEFTLVVF